METLSLTSEGKIEESTVFTAQNYLPQDKKPRLMKAIKKNSQNESRIKSLKNFEMHSSLKPKEQKITSIFIKSKYWRRKKFVAVSPNASEIQVRDRLVIFNNEQIETCYRDLQPEKILSLSKDINRVVSVRKNKSERILELELSTPFENKQHTFKFLIDHFRKIPDQHYQNLYVELRKYQTLVTTMYYRLHSISKQIYQQETYHNEVLAASNKVYDEVKEKVTEYCSALNQNSSNGQTFYFYKIQKVNYESKTYDLVEQGFSYDLMNLLGQNEEKSENYALYTYNNLLSITKQYDGQERIGTQTKLLEAMNNYQSEIKDVKIILQTFDSIDLNCNTDINFIYPTNLPSWMGKQDVTAQVWTFTISGEQLQQVNELRENSVTQSDFSTSDNVEYSIFKDMFFSKFYPNINSSS